MEVIQIADFKAEAVKRFGEDRRKWKFVCPRCKTAQSAEDLLAAGVPLERIDDFLGFSCVGRWDKNRGCDWTLGGLLRIHEIEIESKGKRYPYFKLAEAQ